MSGLDLYATFGMFAAVAVIVATVAVLAVLAGLRVLLDRRREHRMRATPGHPVFRPTPDSVAVRPLVDPDWVPEPGEVEGLVHVRVPWRLRLWSAVIDLRRGRRVRNLVELPKERP